MLFTHSSTGKQGDPLRLYEDLIEPGVGAALQVQVRMAPVHCWPDQPCSRSS